MLSAADALFADLRHVQDRPELPLEEAFQGGRHTMQLCLTHLKSAALAFGVSLRFLALLSLPGTWVPDQHKCCASFPRHLMIDDACSRVFEHHSMPSRTQTHRPARTGPGLSEKMCRNQQQLSVYVARSLVTEVKHAASALAFSSALQPLSACTAALDYNETPVQVAANTAAALTCARWSSRLNPARQLLCMA